MSKDVVAVLDIGTVKICCVIAEVQDGNISIRGAGRHTSKGFRGGCVTDMQALSHSIAEAVAAAESDAGERIAGVMVAVSGSHCVFLQAQISCALLREDGQNPSSWNDQKSS